MDNLIQLAMQILFCLLIAAILGAIIGYLLGKMSKCDKDDYDGKELNNYDSDGDYDYEDTKKIENNTLNKVKDSVNNAYDNSANNVNGSLDTLRSKTASVIGGTVAAATGTVASIVTDNDTQIGQEIGNRPYVITDPDKSAIDDLKEISGIGLKIEEALNNLGIFSFEQIANWSSENIEWVENYLVFKGRIKKEDWIGQAKLLFAGGETEFSKKVRNGDNPNYN